MSSAERVRPSSSCTTAWPLPSWEIWRVASTASRRMTSSGRLPSSSSVEHERGGADLQRGRERAHVGVADEQMQAAILAIVGQRLVARVDDRAVELHPLVDVVDDVIGALADLEIGPALAAGGSKSKASGLACPTRPAPVKICRVARNDSSALNICGVNCASRRMR